MKRSSRNQSVRLQPLDIVGVILVGITLIMAIVGPFVTEYSYDSMNLQQRFLSPSYNHFMGTDEFGRDIFSRVMYGARISVLAAFIVLSISSCIGFFIGSMAGLSGNWMIDEALMRLTDIFLAFPSLVLAVAIAATLGPSLENSIIAISATYWPWYARIVRGQILSLKRREFVIAAQGLGAGKLHITFRHLLPNIFPNLVTQISLEVSSVILMTAGLSFVGVGAQPPQPEWGSMLLSAQQYLRNAWWVATFPGLALTLTAAGFNLLGDLINKRFLIVMKG